MGGWNRDHTGCWGSSSDGTLETRQYFLQNWRADVVAVIDSTGVPIEYVRYSPYGEPTVYAAGDMNKDGVCDSADETARDDLWNSDTGGAVAELDVNRDGIASDSDDYLLVIDQSAYGQWASSGRGVLSRVGVRKGYAGYEWDPATGQDHVRHRVYLPEMGRWGRRDPSGYHEGVALYNLGPANLLNGYDEDGLIWQLCGAQHHNKEPGFTIQNCERLLDRFWSNAGTGGNKKITCIKGLIDHLTCPCAMQPKCTCCDTQLDKNGHPMFIGGGYSNSNCKLELCANNISGAEDFVEMLAHELVHRFDHCNNRLTTCEQIACSEVKAYDFSGSCPPGPDYTQCLIDKAKGSLEGLPCASFSPNINSAFVKRCKVSKDEVLKKCM